MIRIYLSLGTNQGDRRAQLRQALQRLERAFGVAPAALSSIIETPAWGFVGPDFLNCVVRFDLPDPLLPPGSEGKDPRRWTPTRLLDQCQRIERELGRTGAPEWDAKGQRIYHDRPIDIDILFWNTRRIRTRRLSIPHPLIAERDFVLTPLLEIADPAILRAFPEIFATK